MQNKDAPNIETQDVNSKKKIESIQLAMENLENKNLGSIQNEQLKHFLKTVTEVLNDKDPQNNQVNKIEIAAQKIMNEAQKQFKKQWQRLLKGKLDALIRIKNLGQQYAVGALFEKDPPPDAIQTAITYLLYQLDPPQEEITAFMQLHAVMDLADEQVNNKNLVNIHLFQSPFVNQTDPEAQELHASLHRGISDLAVSMQDVMLLKQQKHELNFDSQEKSKDLHNILKENEAHEENNPYQIILDNYNNQIKNYKKNVNQIELNLKPLDLKLDHASSNEAAITFFMNFRHFMQHPVTKAVLLILLVAALAVLTYGLAAIALAASAGAVIGTAAIASTAAGGGTALISGVGTGIAFFTPKKPEAPEQQEQNPQSNPLK